MIVRRMGGTKGFCKGESFKRELLNSIYCSPADLNFHFFGQKKKNSYRFFSLSFHFFGAFIFV